MSAEDYTDEERLIFGDTSSPDDWLVGAAMDPSATTPEPLPALPGFPFLYARSGAVIVGPTGGGRSALIEAGLYDAAGAGLRCVYLGSEVGQEEFNARAAYLAGCRGDNVDDALRAELARVRYLDCASAVTRAWQDPDAWLRGIVERYKIVAIDPLSTVASALDLDFDKSNAEFIQFYDRIVQPLTARGVAVLIVDNVGHAEDAKRRAKGVSAKSDRADLTFSCSPSINPIGLIVKAQKVRSIRAGHQRGDEWLFLKDSQRIERRAREEGDSAAFRPTHIMRKVSEAVERDEGLTGNTIRTTIGGRAKNVDLALALLISEHYIEVRKDGQAHRHYSIRSYREDAETPTASTVSQPRPNHVPDAVPATASHRVPNPVGIGRAGDTVSGGDENSNRVPKTNTAVVDAR